MAERFNLDEWARLGLGVSVLPESRLADPAGHRPLSDDGHNVEIFYEAVWDPRSLLADDLLTLAETLAARARPGHQDDTMHA